MFLVKASIIEEKTTVLQSGKSKRRMYIEIWRLLTNVVCSREFINTAMVKRKLLGKEWKTKYTLNA